MTEKFNLWEYSGKSKPGTIEATRSADHKFVDGMNDVGYVHLDVRDTRFMSGGLPLFPLKALGELEQLCARDQKLEKGMIHFVAVRGLPFGYVVGEQDEFGFDQESLVLNGDVIAPFSDDERRILESMGAFNQGQELTVRYGGVIGEFQGHSSTLRPSDVSQYCFSSVCMRDYFI